MKFSNFDIVKKVALTVTILVALCLPRAFGQVGIDSYSVLRSIEFSTNANTIVTAAAITTNGPVDLFGYTGRGFVDLFSSTNGGGTMTATIQSSPDTTNWTTITNFAQITTPTTYIYTNMFYGSTNSLNVSNNYLLPGTITFGSVGNASNAFAGNFLAQTGNQAFTNGGAVTVTQAGIYRVAFDPRGQTGRYYQLYWTVVGGTATNHVGAVWNGIRSSEVQ